MLARGRKERTITREEAIELLEDLYGAIEDNQGRDYDEALRMAIKALQGDMYCPNCGVRLVPENEYLEPTQTHRRLIDADALSKKLCETTIFIKDGEVFQRMINDAPTVQADRPHGEWVQLFDNTWECTNCEQCEQFGEVIESTSDFCPNCGADMRKGKE